MKWAAHVFAVLSAVVAVDGFHQAARGARFSSTVVGAKGFSEKKKRAPSKTKVERERAAAAYDEAKASGIPEYRVHLKPKTSESWMPMGCVTVPRSESVSVAIYGNLEPLHAAAFALNPRLRDVLDDVGLDYGYNLAIFPDDPVRLASPDEAQQSSNPLLKWVRALTNPMNADGAKTVPPPVAEN